MEQRPFGSTGLTVSALGFGCGAVGGLLVRGDADEQRRAVSRALDAGITYFDTAAQYGDGRSEENLGRVMRELGAWSRVVVGTKVRLRPRDLSSSETAIRASLEASLRRLDRASWLFEPHPARGRDSLRRTRPTEHRRDLARSGAKRGVTLFPRSPPALGLSLLTPPPPEAFRPRPEEFSPGGPHGLGSHG